MPHEVCAKRRQALEHITEALRMLDEIGSMAAAAHLALVAELLHEPDCSD